VIIFSNPPFNLALEWVIRAIDMDIGPVAVIVPLTFLAGLTRAHLYDRYPAAHELVFSDLGHAVEQIEIACEQIEPRAPAREQPVRP